MNSEFELQSEKSPEQIEREIDAQRASIGNIVDALESKFTPGQIIDQAWGMMQSNGGDFLSNLGTSVRNNPVPAVLTSVGLLWMMMSQNRPPPSRVGYRAGPDQGRASEWAEDLSDGIDGARERLHDTADSLKEGYHSLKDKAAHVGDNVHAATDSLRHAAHHAGDRLSRNTQVLGQQFNQLLRDQPLVVAAAGIAIGALIGAALPSTAAEQRYMGRTSAGLVDKVKKQAQEGFEAVRDTVTKTTDHGAQASASPVPPSSSSNLSGGLGMS